MISQYSILKAIKSLLPTDYIQASSVTLTQLDELSKKSCGIFIKDGPDSGRLREVDNCKYYNRTCRIQFLIHGDTGEENIQKSYMYCESIVQIMSGLVEFEYYDSYVKDKAVIVKTRMIGDINSIGRNKQGTPGYSINFIVTYGSGGNV